MNPSQIIASVSHYDVYRILASRKFDVFEFCVFVFWERTHFASLLFVSMLFDRFSSVRFFFELDFMTVFLLSS